MIRWKIMQEAGERARARRAYYRLDLSPNPEPKKVGAVEAPGEKVALQTFVQERYVDTGNRQFAAVRYEWRGERINAKWKKDDGDDKQGREWSAIVTLRNGTRYPGGVPNDHEIRLLAWRA